MSHDPEAGAEAAALPTNALLADRILNPVRKILRLAGLVILAVMIATPMAQVIMRQFFSIPLIGADELSRFMLISVVMLTIPYTVSSGASVRMEEVQHVFPEWVQRALRVMIALLGLAAFTFASWSVLTATLKNLNNATPTLGIPYYIFFSATAVGFFCAALEFALLAWKALMGLPMYVTFAAEQPTEELSL
ncbi:TRAP transporter small permease [Vannielia sp. SX4]|uniref:TRAP transporter small permease n=1 Tax=Vannielia sp. SX4 TaxID=3463852 RepID=UPI004058B354